VSHRLTAARVVETDDEARPVQVQMIDRHGARDYDLTLIQLWELHADISAQLGRHPAPNLSGRKA
jgi:hypothetical protein